MKSMISLSNDEKTTKHSLGPLFNKNYYKYTTIQKTKKINDVALNEDGDGQFMPVEYNPRLDKGKN